MFRMRNKENNFQYTLLSGGLVLTEHSEESDQNGRPNHRFATRPK